MRWGVTALVLFGCLCAAAAQTESVAKFGSNVVIPGGLRGMVHHIPHDTSRLPDFQKLKPKGAIYAASLNVPPQDFKAGFPGVTDRFEWFAIDYTGRFWIDRPGMYTCVLTSDDGARLYLDDQLIIDNDRQHAPEDRTGSIRLTGGIHRIRVSYFQGPRFQAPWSWKLRAPESNSVSSARTNSSPRSTPRTGSTPITNPARSHRKNSERAGGIRCGLSGMRIFIPGSGSG